MLECKPKFVAIDEETNHQIVHGRRFGKADRAAHQTLHAGPQIDMLAFDLLGVLFAHNVLLGIDMSLIGAPPLRVNPRDPKRLQEGCEWQKNGILSPAKDVGQHGPTAVIDGMPHSPRLRFLADVTPHLIEL
jgi:hypothetical protein